MISDDELMRLRMAFLTAGQGIMDETDIDLREAWANAVFDPSPEHLRALSLEAMATRWRGPLGASMLQIGYATAGDVLNGVGLPLSHVQDRRWQLRRELARAVEAMDIDQLQALVWRAKAVAR